MAKKQKKSISDFSADYRGMNGGTHAKSENAGGEEKGLNFDGTVPIRENKMDNDMEIDDFLPENETDDADELLTKWDGGEEEPPEPAEKKRGRHRYGILSGTVVLLLALTGAVFIAYSIGSSVHSKLNDDSKLRAYDTFLTVVVAQNPKPFASPDKADSDFILNASLWKTMTDSSAANYTNYDDAGKTIVPLGDVSDACHELFGPDCKLKPKNPDKETFYTYDADAAQFHVALYSLDSTYTPYTESAKKHGDEVVLRVGYVPPSDETRAQSAQASSGGTPTPAKYMEYVLKTNAKTGKEYIYAINSVK